MLHGWVSCFVLFSVFFLWGKSVVVFLAFVILYVLSSLPKAKQADWFLQMCLYKSNHRHVCHLTTGCVLSGGCILHYTAQSFSELFVYFYILFSNEFHNFLSLLTIHIAQLCSILVTFLDMKWQCLNVCWSPIYPIGNIFFIAICLCLHYCFTAAFILF